MDKRLKLPDYVAQFHLNWNVLDADIAQNVLYVSVQRFTADVPTPPRAWTDDDAAAQAGRIAAAFHTHMASFIHTSAQLESIDWAWNEAVDTGPLHIGSYTGSPLPFAGTNSGAPANNGVSLAINLSCGLGGRGYHGRFFMVGVNAGLWDAAEPNKLKASSISDFSAALPLLMDDVNYNDLVLGTGSQYSWSVESFVLHGALRATALDTPITSVSLRDPYFDFQRRRAPAHSRHH